jgi:hypothetical protein
MIIHSLFGQVKVYSSFKEFLSKNGIYTLEGDKYPAISRVEVDGFAYIPPSDEFNMTNPFEYQSITPTCYDHENMDDTWSALEQDLIKTLESEVVHLIGDSFYLNSDNTTILVDHTEYILRGIDSAIEKTITSNMGWYDATYNLVYLGNDTFTIVDNYTKLGIKTKEPCGFFLYTPNLYKVSRYKIDGLETFFKKKGVISEER